MSHFAYRLGLPLCGLLSVLSLGSPACSPPDPCQGQSSSCLTVQVETQGDVKIDLIRTIYSVNGGTSQQQGFATASNTASSLPIAFALALGDGGTAQVEIVGELGANAVLRGSTTETLAAGEHKRVVVSLGRDVSKLPFIGPEPRYGAGLAAVPISAPTTIVMFGGVVVGDQPLSETWEYDLTQNTWQRSTSAMSPGPRQPQMVADPTADRVLVVQGLGAGGVVQPDAWQFGPTMPGAVRSWTPLTTVTSPLPPRGAAGLTILPSMTGTPLAFFFGGIDGVGGNPRSDLWRMLTPSMTNFATTAANGAPVIRGPKLFATQTDVYLVGCEDTMQTVMKVWRLDTTTTPNNWMVLSNDGGAPSYRQSFAAAIDPQTGMIAVFGGKAQDGSFLSDSYRFNVQGGSWSTVSGDQNPPARIDASMTFANGRYYLVGGRDSNLKPRLDNWKLTTEGWKRWL